MSWEREYETERLRAMWISKTGHTNVALLYSCVKVKVTW